MNARCASTVKDPMYHFTWERWTGRLPHANFDRCSPDQADEDPCRLLHRTPGIFGTLFMDDLRAVSFAWAALRY